MIEIIIVGSGTGAPSLRRAAPGICVCQDDYRILLDCGAGTLRQLLQAGIPCDRIDAIFLSHFHPDHVGDLIPFLFATKYSLGYQRTSPFRLFAHPRFENLYERLKEAFGEWIVPPSGLMRVETIGTDTRNLVLEDNLRLSFSPVPHTPESLAIRIDTEDGKSVVYSGDTDYSTDLIHLATGADLLICECSCPEAGKVSGHLTPSLAGKMAAQAGCKKLLLTHLYPVCDQFDMVGPCRRHFEGELVVACDLMRIVL